MYYHGWAESFNGGGVGPRRNLIQQRVGKQIGPAVQLSTAGPQFTEE